MPFFKSLNTDAGPPVIYQKFPDMYGPWSTMSEAMMNGPSPLSRAERELIFSYAAGAAGCEFVYVAHSEVAYALGVEPGTLEKLMRNPGSAPVEARLRPLLAFVRKLACTPSEVTQADADAVFDTGWSEDALQHAIGIVGRAAFMHRLVAGHGFIPISPESAARKAKRRIELGYVNLYPAFREKDEPRNHN